MKIILKDKIRGSLLGGAIGDALGYPVEFMNRLSILKKFGEDGITCFCIGEQGKAVISDDTQMTLFTANGLLFGITRWRTYGILAGLDCYVKEAYKEWYQTQTGKVDYQKHQTCWIRDIKRLNVQRAPGNTCISALADPDATNNSKGCGGIMRVAPVAMVIASEICIGHDSWEENYIQKLASECAAITHKHPMGYICAAVFADILFQIFMCKDSMTKELLIRFIEMADTRAHNTFTKEKEIEECRNLRCQINNAIRLSESPIPDHEAIRQLGEGWTGDEALAIALFCTLRHIDNFHAALVAAVNHDGDSDSTGAICGNLMGAIVGSSVCGFPDVQKLELKTLILEIADDIIKGCTLDGYHSSSCEDEKQWEKRYVFGEDYITPFEIIFRQRLPHIILPKAKRMKKAYSLFKMLDRKLEQYERCSIAYEISLAVFDREDFSATAKLEYEGVDNGEPDYYSLCEKLLPAYYWGYEDPVYSPLCNNRVFKLNVDCYRGKSLIIAVRDDCGCQKIDLNESFSYKLRAGLEPFTDANLQKKFSDWLFLRVDYKTVDADGYAVFTNQLEGEFSVEIAHLGNDGELHRIYLLSQ